jgi:hypothetical protein
MGGVGSTKYIPSNDVEYCPFTKNVYDYADEHHERWGVSAPTDSMKTHLDDLVQLVEKCKAPTRSKVDTHMKNEARKISEKELRNYLQGMVMRNVNVTNKDRELRKLPIYDTKPTPVGDPVGVASAAVVYRGGQVLELLIKHMDGTPFDKKTNYGYSIYHGLYAESDLQPENGEDLPKHRFTRRKKEIFKYAQSDVRKTAYFCIRYENSKGVAGQWGPMIAAIIP